MRFFFFLSVSSALVTDEDREAVEQFLDQYYDEATPLSTESSTDSLVRICFFSRFRCYSEGSALHPPPHTHTLLRQLLCPGLTCLVHAFDCAGLTQTKPKHQQEVNPGVPLSESTQEQPQNQHQQQQHGDGVQSRQHEPHPQPKTKGALPSEGKAANWHCEHGIKDRGSVASMSAGDRD